MADLLVRGIDDELVRALEERAGAHGRSVEAEHREILAAALMRPRGPSFAEILASMPEVGIDADFQRAASVKEAPRSDRLAGETQAASDPARMTALLAQLDRVPDGADALDPLEWEARGLPK